MKLFKYTFQEQTKSNFVGLTLKSTGFCVILFFINALTAQNVGFTWSKKLGGTGNDQGQSVTVDGAGNVYTTGGFNQTADFDPGTGTSNLISNGSFDIYVSKLDAAGNYLWAKSFGASGIDKGYSIAVDALGNVYVTGQFSGTVDFNPGLGTNNLTSNAGYDAFVLKLNSSGNYLWAKSIGGVSSDDGKTIQVDDAGNVFVIGQFAGTVDFDPGPGTSNLTSNSGTWDVYMLKLNTSGNFVWAKSFGGGSNDVGHDLQLDAQGNIYTTGSFRNSVDFDPGPGVTNKTSVNGAQDVFISKFNSSGNFQWVKTFGGVGDDIGYKIVLDKSGNMYTMGEYAQTADFDPGTGIKNLTSNGGADVFITKLDTNGSLIWAKSTGGSDIDKGGDLAIDAIGNIYITGHFRGTADFDPGKGTTNLTSSGFADIFVYKLNPLGNLSWVEIFGHNLEDKGSGIHVDGSGNIYMTGEFMVSVDFDFSAANSYITTSGGTEAYVVKFSCAPTTGVHEATACNKYLFNGITYTSDNTTAKDTLTNSMGCDSIITLNLTISTMDVTTTQTGNTISANLLGASYQWINCSKGNASIIGATNASYTATANGDYAVIISYKGCTDTSDCVTISTVGTDDLVPNAFQISPNPNNGYFTIDLGKMHQNTTVQIVDLSGRILQSNQYNSRQLLKLDMAEPTGLYILIVETSDQKAVMRLVKN